MAKKAKNLQAVQAAEIAEIAETAETAKSQTDIETMLDIASHLDKPVKAYEVRRRVGYMETIARIELDNET